MVNGFALPHSLTQQIVQRSGGNPFFIEEVVRSLFEQGAIVRREGGFEVTEKAHAITIPPTITDVLMARIDRLEEGTRHLVKVASVIGRSFFLRILSEVASEVEDIPGKLSLLSEIQILQPQERMGEVEYLFKHALAQEAAYESLLPPRRRELHLKVAHAIEKIFSQRLPEFYGMLGYHYSRAEDREKTEEYLIKAGEEALKSAASDGALHYYEEALQIYLQKAGPDADPEKVATLEKNIALALYNRGRYEEAVKYFDRTLNCSWGKLPKHPIAAVLKSLSGLSHLLISLYLPSLKFKRIPTASDKEAIDLFFKKLKAMVVVNPRRSFVESFYFYKKLTDFDLAEFDSGIGMFVGGSTLFLFTGIFFGLSKRILDLVKERVDKDDVRQFTIYDFSETLYNLLKGNWKAIRSYDDGLVDKNLAIGETYWASMHYFWHGWPQVYQGNLDASKFLVNRLDDLYRVYENDFSLLAKYLLNTALLMEGRRPREALVEAEKGLSFAQEHAPRTSLIQLFSWKARIHMLMGDMEEAEKSLQRADQIRREVHMVPWQLSCFFRSQFEYDLYRLRESIDKGNQVGALTWRKKAIRSGELLSRMAVKVAQHRTDSCRLKGTYYWLINEKKKALKWWHEAIEEGERLGARLDLSRVYFEVGRRLLESKNSHGGLDGVKAKEYLEKARALFEEMDLQWDLDELNRVTETQKIRSS